MRRVRLHLGNTRRRRPESGACLITPPCLLPSGGVVLERLLIPGAVALIAFGIVTAFF
jgi:hypothetical protein